MVVFHNGSALGGSDALPDLNARVFILIVLSLTAGTTLLMWMGELSPAAASATASRC